MQAPIRPISQITHPQFLIFLVKGPIDQMPLILPTAIHLSYQKLEPLLDLTMLQG